MKKLTKKEKLLKKQENYNLWRHCYIFPFMGLSLISFTATIVSLMIGVFTGNFAATGILAISTVASTAASYAAYKLNPVIDIKFHDKLIEIENELEEIKKQEANNNLEIEVKSEPTTVNNDLICNVDKPDCKKVGKYEYNDDDDLTYGL